MGFWCRSVARDEIWFGRFLSSFSHPLRPASVRVSSDLVAREHPSFDQKIRLGRASHSPEDNMHQRRKPSREEKEVIDVARIKQLQEMAAAAQPQYGVKEVTEEAWLLTKLAFLLLRFLMGSYKWIVRVARLSAFVLLLSPALLPMAYRYFKSP